MSSPDQLLMQLITGKWVSKALSLVAELAVADHVSDGPRHVEDLAAVTGMNADALYRLLRATAALGVLKELPGQRFENNVMSNMLRSTPGSLRGMMRWLGDDSAWRAWGRLDYSVQTGQPAFDKVMGMQVFEHFQHHPEVGQVFNDAMVSFTQITGPAVAKGYDFSGIKTLVDIGGGHGALIAKIAQKHPALKGVLFDRPEVVAGAGALLTAEGVADRVTPQGGDFLHSVPAGADAYIMKHIIHDWDDAHSIAILSHCRKAMAPGGKVLIVEQLVSDRPEAAAVKLIDLEMLVMTTGGRERTETEFSALLGKAGLRLTRIVPTESPVVVVESVAV
jgi:hypothetical protein